MEKKAVSGLILTLLLTCMLYTMLNVRPVAGWSNGGFSDDPSDSDYGTHDWIAQHALDWLPTHEKYYILDNLVAYLYGTELPDNNQAVDGIGDTAKHHVYYLSNGSLQDNAAAERAFEEYYGTLNFLKAKNYAKAAKNAGIMSHYIVDMAVFGHVMGSGTDWGAEVHHSDYEAYVNGRTSSYNAEFNSYLTFDGSLTEISAYDAAKDLAYDTTFDLGDDLTCVWMDQNYDWSDLTFRNRAGQSLNLAVNYLTDVLHTLYHASIAEEAYISLPHHYQIKSYYCGPAALEMVFDFYGEDIPQLEIADVARTAPDGTYTCDMVRAAHFSNLSTSVGREMPENITGYTVRKLGYAAFEYSDMTLDELKALIAAGYPIIVLTTWHYRVAVGYNSTHITFQDSYYGEMFNMTYEDFDVDWDYSGHWGLFVSPWQIEISNPPNVLLGSVFNVTATITYPSFPPFSSDHYPASVANATVTLPEGLALVSGETANKTIGPGDLAAGTSADVTWTVRADSLGAYPISVEAEGKVTGFVPSLPSYPGSYSYEERIGGFCQTVVAVTSDGIPPTTFDDYDSLWHTTDFTITLTATDNTSGVAETYYKINYGLIQNVSIHGQPRITTENSSNTLEYWSVDKAGNEERPHKILIGIKLDKTTPTGFITINNGDAHTTTVSVMLTLTANDGISGVYQVRLSNDGVWDTEPWETPSTTETWTLTPDDGTKTIYFQVKDNAGLISITYSDMIVLDTAPPVGSIIIAGDAAYTNSFSVTLSLSATDTGSAVAQMRFSYDNTTWTNWETYSSSKPWLFTTGDGTKTVYVQFTDNVGFVTQSYFDTIMLDTTAPTVLITSPMPGYQVRSSTVGITWTGSDETSGINHYEIRLDDGSWTNIGTNTTHTFTDIGDGSHAIDIKVIDKTRNTKQDTVNFTVNTSPLLGPGYIEEIVITAIIIMAILGAAVYLKIRKKS